MLQLYKTFRRVSGRLETVKLIQNNRVLSTSIILIDSTPIRFPVPPTISPTIQVFPETELIRPKAVYICDKCERSFKSAKGLKQHQKYSRKCISEHQVFESSDAEYKLNIHHEHENLNPSKDPSIATSSTDNDSSMYECKHCGKAFRHPESLARHLKICKVLKKKKFESISEEVLERTKDLRSPIIFVEDGKNIFECKSCGTRVNQRNNFTRHLRTCSVYLGKLLEESDVEIPGNQFNTHNSLGTDDASLNKHDEKRIFESDNEEDVKKSVKKDYNPAIFPCPGCDKSYSSVVNLRRHIKRSCPNPTPIDMELMNSIKREHGLLRTAPKDEKFPCPKCGKEFIQKFYLDKHIETCKVGDPEEMKRLEEEKEKKRAEKEKKVAELREEKLRATEKNEAMFVRLQELIPDNNEAKDEANPHQSRQEILHSYFDLVVNTGNLSEAYKHFQDLSSNPAAAVSVQTTKIFNCFLRGYARRGDIDTTMQIWEEMKDLGVKEDLNSYISLMMCFHNADEEDIENISSFNSLFKNFVDDGYNLEKSIHKREFLLSDKKMLTKALKKFKSSETLSYKSFTTEQPDLVKKLQYLGTNNLKSQLFTVLDRSELQPLLNQQVEMERGLTVSIPSICVNDKADTIKLVTDSLMSTWKNRVKRALQSLYVESEQPLFLNQSSLNLRKFLSMVPIDQLTDLIMAKAEVMLVSDSYSESINNIRGNLGTEVNAIYHNMVRTEKKSFNDFINGIDKYLDWYCDPKGSESFTHKDALGETMKDVVVDTDMVEWPYTVRLAIGRELLKILMSEIVFDRDKYDNVVVNGKIYKNGKLQPAKVQSGGVAAFFKTFRKRKDFLDSQEIKPHPSLQPLFGTVSLSELKFPPEELPMIVPPLPWVSDTTGGNLIRKSKFVRYPFGSSDEHEKLLDELPPGGLNPILDSINQLGSVAWIVNKPILNLACQLFTDLKADRSLLSELDIPVHPDTITADFHQCPTDISEALRLGQRLTPEQSVEWRNYNKNMELLKKIKSEAYSLWCTSLYRLSLAKHFEDNILWFPHNIDFRGRCYPMPPLLNHMGSDLPRSLLVFARGKKLGDNGLRWLKLHCINLTGLLKRESVEDRLDYVETIMDKIIDSATNPLDGDRWWLDSDDPWQTLSACMEIKKAMEHPEGPEEYICHLPIHQDGSCNGLQHYAALGRDVLGASAVNLVPADKPQDVYSEIAAIVDRRRAEDADNGHEIAMICEGFIKRKVVKQTVMTTVYGVTKYGAQLQIRKQLRDIEEFPKDYLDDASKYLASKTFESLNELFTSSQEIQDWLTECAGVISKDCKYNVQWVTPLGYPVVQPYSKKTDSNKYISLDMEFKNKSAGSNAAARKIRVNSMKNRNGFPPNFVHSLDSSHMMLTSLYLWPRGITFASVHDCFWTHASDVEIMNKVCRDQFIALHSSPILENLSEHFISNFSGLSPDQIKKKKLFDEQGLQKMREDKKLSRLVSKLETSLTKREMLFKNVPKKGELDLNVIHDSTYFFS